MVNFRNLSILLLAMVVSLILSNVYLYHRSYYGQPSLLVISRAWSTSDQLLHRFDVKGEQGVKDGTATKQSRLVESDTKWMNLTTRGDFSEETRTSPEHRFNSSISPRWNFTDSHWHATASSLRNYTSHHGNPTRPQQNYASPLQNPTSTGNGQHIVPALSDSRPQTTDNSASRAPAMRKWQFIGYLLTLKVYEQQTMATGNLMQLQCFASKLNVSVVQPFTKDSALTTPLDESQHQHMLRLEDVYNMEDWNQYAEREGYAPLVKWEEFIKYAPRDVVLVQMKYPLLSQVKKFHSSGKAFPHPLSESRLYQKGCSYKVAEKAMKALRRKDFRVIRRVCYNFLSGDDIPLQVYQHELWGGESPTNVTVIIDQWRGIGENQRFLIKENICPGSSRYREYAHSSSKVVRDAQLYADKFLYRNGNTNYLAVIARYEMTAITRKMTDKGDPNAVIPICIEETLKEISEFKSSSNLTEIFLSVDIGKYGSHSFVSHQYYGHQKDMESFVQRVYDNRMDFTDWERSFETIAEKLDPGYIAKVQQAIVAQARCVLFVGGGSFQQHTLHMYQELHPRAEDRCVRVEKRCTSKYRPVQ